MWYHNIRGLTTWLAKLTLCVRDQVSLATHWTVLIFLSWQWKSRLLFHSPKHCPIIDFIRKIPSSVCNSFAHHFSVWLPSYLFTHLSEKLYRSPITFPITTTHKTRQNTADYFTPPFWLWIKNQGAKVAFSLLLSVAHSFLRSWFVWSELY